MNHSFVFHWTGRFVSKCQLKNFCHFTFCQNTKAFVFLGVFWSQNTSSERNLMTQCATCRVPTVAILCFVKSRNASVTRCSWCKSVRVAYKTQKRAQRPTVSRCITDPVSGVELAFFCLHVQCAGLILGFSTASLLVDDG